MSFVFTKFYTNGLGEESGYLIPFSEREANIVIGYPDYPENREKDLEQLWQKYYQKVCKDLRQNLKITDRFEVTRYIIGICKYPRIGNTFFVGNCFGTIMPFLGFGQFPALLTGVYAAYDLCGKGSYEELVKPLMKSYNHSLILRRSLETLDNSKLDWLVRRMKGKTGNVVFNSRRVDFLKLISYILRLIPLKNKVEK